MKKFILMMLVMVGGVLSASAATETTVYYAVSSATVGSYSVKLKVNRQGDNDNPATYDMTKTNKTYDGKYIYSCTYTDLYDGVSYMLFQLWNGDTWISEDCGVGYPEGGGIHWVWTSESNYNGKLHVHGNSSWQTYNTDGLKGSWDSWTDKIDFINGQATVNLTAGTYKDFKIEVGGSLYGAQNSGATMFWNNCTNWTLNGSSDCILQASVSGKYTFTLAEDKNVSVTFPSYTPSEVYVYNNMSLADGPYAFILKGDYWDDTNGSGSKNQPKGVTMTQVGTSNVWKAEYPAGAKTNYIVFTEYLMNDYNNFNGGKAVYRGDFPTTTSVFVPNTSSSDTKNGTTYYNLGEWHSFPTYTRDVTEGNFGTICLPFTATVTGATVYKIVSKTVDGKSNLTGINLESVDALEAGKAYIFKATGSTLTATLSGNYADASAGYGMMGNIGATIKAPLNSYVVSGNQLRKVSADDAVNVGKYKGYVTLTDIGEANSRSANFIGFNDETTGIESIANAKNANVVYNLNGQRVTDRQKGLVIVNGKKMLRK